MKLPFALRKPRPQPAGSSRLRATALPLLLATSSVFPALAVLDYLQLTVRVAAQGWQYERREHPPRTIVRDARGEWLATFTDGSRSVALAGADRSFEEPEHTRAVVTHDRWVRLLDQPFDGKVNGPWLLAAQRDETPDVLAVAMQYVRGAPRTVDAGNATYGPRRGESREEGADFNDYLGVPWTYAGRVDQPERRQRRGLDCSGFVRMVFGYRFGLPLSLQPDGTSLPRRAWMQYASGPGRVIIPDAQRQASAYNRLQEGDLVFFDASRDDGDAIDHVGIYLGVDDEGNHRFISSRKTANGPTLGDEGGRSLLNPVDGTGTYARAFRAARRL